jgi:hypothetical protein
MKDAMTTRVAKLLLIGLTLSTPCVHATQSVRQEAVSVSRSLAGQVVVLGTEEPATGVTVALCSPGWKRFITSTTTDQKGQFLLEPVTKAKLYFLRVSAPGMDIYQLRVRIDKHVGQELNIHLSVAT